MKNLFWMLLLGCVVTTWSCKKEDAITTGPTRTKAEIAARTWQLQTLSILINGAAVQAYTKGGTQNLAELSKYSLKLMADGKMEQTHFDATKRTGTWKLTENNTQLEITDTGTGVVSRWKLVDLTDTSFDFTQQIAAGTTDAAEKMILDGMKQVGLDTSKGASLTVRLTPSGV
ncbi:hypothetical protein [Tellurirhabdus rosea]|uniref:hypothetical protein n=1 Tax=Tellurirhabdus rosea TaxID=2674997 RepID=UPI00225C0982|nr:hypothetical protein [Tellurirhabdus rosea]